MAHPLTCAPGANPSFWPIGGNPVVSIKSRSSGAHNRRPPCGLRSNLDYQVRQIKRPTCGFPYHTDHNGRCTRGRRSPIYPANGNHNWDPYNVVENEALALILPKRNTRTVRAIQYIAAEICLTKNGGYACRNKEQVEAGGRGCAEAARPPATVVTREENSCG
ncbi:hypothetical protein JCGZ_03152 [Jatropha curcas]|uniref:Uncharacterized protein n=1 Tax=Jatropha curcas TaxID=180498 RepID=A0A067JDR8_JATCU|nr:hypothetical protein JCGZ_03152 [Jatropha curcas]